MAIGDDASDVGYQLVPDTGEDGKVKYGAREINRTRDYTARVLKMLDERPKTKADYQQANGISYGTGAPNNNQGTNGDIYFRYS